MSEHGFHVHGPHNHELEYAAQGHGSSPNKVAMFTAIIATVGAIFGYMGGATQAKSSKQNLSELALGLLATLHL